MRKLLTAAILLVIIFNGGCSSSKGHGNAKSEGGAWSPSKKKISKKAETPPDGMVLIPGGSFVLGGSDEDLVQAYDNNPKTETLDAFWMDQTEITNYEYRNFIEYVKEYNLRKKLGESDESYLVTQDKDGVAYDEPKINWNVKINYSDENVRQVLNEFNYGEDESLLGKKEYDVRSLTYDWSRIDYDKAARVRWDNDTKSYIGTILNDEGEEVPVKSRADFIIRNSTYIYPDTLCWMRDFKYSYNEPFMTRYFWHPAYSDYPVVGVSWVQAEAYCYFRTDTEEARNGNTGHYYRLPTEAEWEYAARGGLPMQTYPWGGPYTSNRNGCYLANFKPQRGKYGLDGGVRTLPVGSYEANDYGLFDMAGNVAEWTNNSYDESAYTVYNDLVPTYAYNAKKDDPMSLKRKVVRGGSWKDVAYYMQCGTRSYEYQDQPRSYIGFRTVRSYMGNPRRK